MLEDCQHVIPRFILKSLAAQARRKFTAITTAKQYAFVADALFTAQFRPDFGTRFQIGPESEFYCAPAEQILARRIQRPGKLVVDVHDTTVASIQDGNKARRETKNAGEVHFP